jgi:glycerophosphoryl diester phosphodiesterase
VIDAVKDLRGAWRPALQLHLFVRIAGFAVAAPLLTLAFRGLLAAAGDRVVSNYDIAAFLLSPAGAALAAAAAAAGTGLFVVELAGLAHIAEQRLEGRAATLGAALAVIARRIPAILSLGARIVLRLALIALPFVLAAALAWRGWLGDHDVNYYLAEQPPEWTRMLRFAAILGTGCALAVAWQLARWIYAIPALVLRPEPTAGEALAVSARVTRGQLLPVLRPLLAWWLVIGAVSALLLFAGRSLSVAAFSWAGMSVTRVLPVAGITLASALIAETLLSALALAGHQFLSTRGYAARSGRGAEPAAEAAAGMSPGRLATRAIAAVLAVAALAAGGAWIALSRIDLRPRVEVTAHRGASVGAPENTLAAFRAALTAGTDWIELDVQRTADGRIVVIHDGDFLRVGGDPRKVGAVAASELDTIDVGRKYGAAFAGERVPLLEDAIALVRGRARLNVELKYNVPDPALAPAVLGLLRRERFLDQAVVTSLDYGAVRQVEGIDPAVVTGLIVTAAVGDVLGADADFLSLNAARATAALVRRAHRAGKRVHVWTVNTPDAMLELAARGVDNIITDDPALFADVRARALVLSPQEMLALRLRALMGQPPREIADPAAMAEP